jgi:hypothetical protein
MTKKRMAGTIAAAFVVSQVLEALIHGFVLANDYAPYYGSLLRSGDDGSGAMLVLPFAHLSMICGLVWIFARLPLAGSQVARGLKIGLLGWFVGAAPVWLLWYAEQPWPGSLVVKQLPLELLSSLAIGLTIAFVAGKHTNEPRAA